MGTKADIDYWISLKPENLQLSKIEVEEVKEVT